MQKFSILLIFVSGFSQINWQTEIVDDGSGLVGYSNSLALDINNIPQIAYTITQTDTNLFMYAYKPDSLWQKEVVDVCLPGGQYWGLPYYGVSLAIDQNSKVYSSYYRYDSLNNKTEICYAHRDTLGWTIQILDTISGTIEWPPIYHTSIALDTISYPAIAYSYWNFPDSTQYIKYLHYNGTNWDSYIVEDSCTCWDYGPSLKIDKKNQPHIAFYQTGAGDNDDSLKYSYFNNELNTWIIAYRQGIDFANTNASLSLALNSQDYPGIAYSLNGALAYSWYDGAFWHTEIIGGAGFSEVSIDLDLDNFDNPHIAYTVEFNFWLEYCYKETIWHLCGPHYGAMGDVSLALDNNSNPHISYDGGLLNYAKGTFVGIEEASNKIPEPRYALQVYPNPSRGTTNIDYALHEHSEIALSIYDVTGVMVKQIKQGYIGPGYYREKINTENLSSGVYFIVLKQGNDKVSMKFLIVK